MSEAKSVERALLRYKWRFALSKIYEYLDAQPLVRGWNHSRRGAASLIKVRFTDGIRENWQIQPGYNHHTGRPKVYHNTFVFPEGLALTEDVPIYRQYTTLPEIDEEFDPFFIAQKSDIRNSGFVNIRIMVHELIQLLTDEEWIDFKYPSYILYEDLEKVISTNHLHHISSPNRLQYFTGWMRGRKIIQHFFPVAHLGIEGDLTIAEAWKDPRNHFKAINHLVAKGHDITRYNVFRVFQSNSGGFRAIGPRLPWATFWRGFLEYHFPQAETIADFDPGLGGKLMACVLQKLNYYYLDSEFNDNYKRLAAFLNGSVSVYEEQEADVGLLSGEMPLEAEEAISRLSEHLGAAQSSVIFVWKHAVDQVEAAFPPLRKLRFRRIPWDADDYILIY